MRRAACCTLSVLCVFVAACSSAGPDAETSPSSSGMEMDAGPRSDAGEGGAADSGTDTGTVVSDAAIASPEAGDATDDATDGAGVRAECYSSSGAPGTCITVSACAALTNYNSTAGECPGPTSVECCTKVPSTTDNPPFPAGYKLMMQADVTSAMTAWAVMILHDPVTYPMFSTVMQTFGTLMVLAVVEWHPPDFQNSVVHRGVTLFEPI